MQDATSPLRRLALALALAVPMATTGCMAATDESEEIDDGDEVAHIDETEEREDGATGSTVLQAAGSSCSTTSVKGLSLQIISEVRCMNPDAYVAVPKVGSVTFGSAVFPYLEKPARDKLVAALQANPSKAMTVNSMLRTVAQQYLLYRWYQTGRCSISLAAKPGNSNHETGLALDISQYSAWKTILQNRGFKWLGSSDPVHFDYAGAGAVSYKGLDVKAFQRLWNRNNVNDKISADGVWGPQTEARMKAAPAGGFAKGATCGSKSTGPEESIHEEEMVLPDAAWDLEAASNIEAPLFLTLPVEDTQPEVESCGHHAH